MDQRFYARGKILLSSEFLILHGAKALALPLKLGQSLELKRKKELGILHWIAYYKEKPWFETKINLDYFKIKETSSQEKSQSLVFILQQLEKLKPGFIEKLYANDVDTVLEFDPEYGFGSSSTLTSLLAQWANVDPMQLHYSISKGSGYDVACADAESAILYQVINEMPVVESVDFQPDFIDQMYLVYLGQKQNSSKSVEAFLNNYTKNQSDIDFFSKITCEFLKASNMDEFGELINQHEQRLSEILSLPTIKEVHFKVLDGYSKSLGAWGGDFALLISKWDKQKLSSYLSSIGIDQLFTYNDLVL